MVKTRFSDDQKKIMYTAGIGVSFLLFWIFIFLPQNQQVDQLKQELQATEKLIANIETLGGDADDPSMGIRHLTERFEVFKKSLPSKEETGVRMLSDTAQEHGLEVVLLKTQPKTPIMDENNLPLTLDNRICQQVFVSLQLRGSYQDLLKYLTEIHDDLPGFFIFKKVNVSTVTPGVKVLSISLDLTFYLLS